MSNEINGELEREIKGLQRELVGVDARLDEAKRKNIVEQLAKRGVKIGKVEKAVKK